MLKRFYSKKSGFTLAEIIVAFAIFAIMASMVAEILDLAIKARQANNLYAQELARQEKLLTVIQKDSAYYDASGPTGTYNIVIDSDTYSLNYQTKATDPSATNQSEGINYFLSPVKYDAVASGDPTEDAGAIIGGMTQASRMDTRISGTEGLGYIKVNQVIKDTYSYPAGHPFAVPAGHTRYLIEISAAGIDYNTNKTTLKEENVPYAEYRLEFYHSDVFDEASSEANGLDVYKKAKIVKVGHVDMPFSSLSSGLTESNTSSGSDVSNMNKYTVEQRNSNGIRVCTPYEMDGSQRGVRFSLSQYTRFYIEFDGDPNLTTASFGYNGRADGSATIYEPCPKYKAEYNDDGTPTYAENEDGTKYPVIYGAYMYTKRPEATPPATPETPTE